MGIDEVQGFFLVLVAICAAAGTIWGGVKAIKEALRPLTDLMERVDEHSRLLANDHSRLNDLEASSRLMLRAISELIEHEVSGDHIERLEQIQADISDYLINRQGATCTNRR